MGFQKGNDNSQQAANVRSQSSSRQRTSGIKAVEKMQSGKQDARLRKTGPLTGKGD